LLHIASNHFILCLFLSKHLCFRTYIYFISKKINKKSSTHNTYLASHIFTLDKTGIFHYLWHANISQPANEPLPSQGLCSLWLEIYANNMYAPLFPLMTSQLTPVSRNSYNLCFYINNTGLTNMSFMLHNVIPGLSC